MPTATTAASPFFEKTFKAARVNPLDFFFSQPARSFVNPCSCDSRAFVFHRGQLLPGIDSLIALPSFLLQ